MKDNSAAYSSNDYDSRIESVLPYYCEFHRQVIDLVKAAYPNESKIKWLDTGCGTGSLAHKATEQADNIEFTLCDRRRECLKRQGKSLSELT